MKKHIKFILLICLYFIIFVITSYHLYKRLGVFGCGDECINYTAAYFMQKGKVLYGQIFYNRQPAMALISFFVQRITHPSSLYTLVLYHRLAIMIYALFMGLVIIWRFRATGLLFLILYEGTKFYSYGYQFIGEAVVVYPLVYLFGLVWIAIHQNKLHKSDGIIAVLCASFIFWAREPYVPAAFTFFFFFLWLLRKKINIHTYLFLFLIFILVPFIWIDKQHYVQQVFAANVHQALLHPKDVMYAFGYPIFIFLQGKLTYLRVIEWGIGIFIIIGIWKNKKITPMIIMFGLLGLAGIRSVPPGTMYYEAFHMLPWYALFCMLCVLLLHTFRQKIAFLLFCVWVFASPQAFIWEKIDTVAEFTTQYAKYTQYSNVIKAITKPSEKIFLDEWDDIIYWESGRDSSYELSLYIPTTNNINEYKKLRRDMFINNPPVIYYRCPKIGNAFQDISKEISNNYMQVLYLNLPSCLYIDKSKFVTLTKQEKDVLRQNGFSDTIGL